MNRSDAPHAARESGGGTVQLPAGSRRRILVLTTSYPTGTDDWRGGFVRAGVQALASRGHVPRVITPFRGIGALPGGDDRDAGPWPTDPGEVAVRRFRWAPWRERLRAPAGIPEAVASRPWSVLEVPLLTAAFARHAVSASESADAILSHWGLPCGLLGGWVARRRRIPHVAVLHSADVHLLRRLPGGRRLATRIGDGADRVFAVSDFVRDAYVALLGRDPGRIADRVEVVCNPLDEADFAPPDTPPGGRPRFLFVGRLVDVKGVATLVDAAKPGDPFDVVIAGGGPLEPLLRGRVRGSGAPVSIEGDVTPARRRDLLRAATAVIVPSLRLPGGRTEGAPVVIAEAFAMGVPVIASAVGGIPGSVTDGLTGFLVPPGDAGALRAVLLRIAAQRLEDRTPMSAACIAAAERHRPARFASAVAASIGVPGRAC